MPDTSTVAVVFVFDRIRREPDLSLFLSGRALTLFELVAHLSAQGTGSRLVGLKLFSDDREVGLVSRQPQHNQVS